MTFDRQFVVIGKDNEVLALTTKFDTATSIFAMNHGSRMEQINSVEELLSFLNGHVTSGCDVNATGTESMIANCVMEGNELLDVALETFWTEVGKRGVTREKIVVWLDSLQNEGGEVAQQTRQLIKTGVNRLGNLLYNLGNKLQDTPSDSSSED